MISRTAEYALRAVTHLASRTGAPPTTAQVSRATHVPSDYLAKVLRGLSRAGLVRSQRGPGGGHTLARDPSRMTVLDVVTAVDPLPRIRSCPLGLKDHLTLCPLHRRLDSAVAMVEAAFRQTTIAELVPKKSRTATTCLFPCLPIHELTKAETAAV
jgi:Rrf2 family transcriptional regulator, nitric oxide-sensitive transcriptional repressor